MARTSNPPRGTRRLTRRLIVRLAALAVAVLALGGCSDGQVVDAGGERGGGGLAFVVMVFFLALFAASLFYMDHVRKRRSREED